MFTTASSRPDPTGSALMMVSSGKFTAAVIGEVAKQGGGTSVFKRIAWQFGI